MSHIPTLALGTSLFSLTHEHHARKLTLAQQIYAVAERGLGPGLELVGYQCLRGFPVIDPEFARWFRDAANAHGLEPSCLDGEVDLALRRTRHQTEDEVVEAIQAQLAAAQALGFPVLRLQMLATPKVVERCVPTAERLGVAIGLELDSFWAVDHPLVQAMRVMVETLGSPFVGFVPDFGASMRGIPAALLRSLHERGVPEQLLLLAEEIWLSHRSPDARMAALTAAAPKNGGTSENLALLRVPMIVCGGQDPAAWQEIAPFTVHVHAKFFEFDEKGDEPSIDHGAALGALVRGGFRGTVSSEWGGVMYTDSESGLDMVARHHELLRRAVPAP